MDLWAPDEGAFAYDLVRGRNTLYRIQGPRGEHGLIRLVSKSGEEIYRKLESIKPVDRFTGKRAWDLADAE